MCHCNRGDRLLRCQFGYIIRLSSQSNWTQDFTKCFTCALPSIRPIRSLFYRCIHLYISDRRPNEFRTLSDRPIPFRSIPVGGFVASKKTRSRVRWFKRSQRLIISAQLLCEPDQTRNERKAEEEHESEMKNMPARPWIISGFILKWISSFR